MNCLFPLIKAFYFNLPYPQEQNFGSNISKWHCPSSCLSVHAIIYTSYYNYLLFFVHIVSDQDLIMCQTINQSSKFRSVSNLKFGSIFSNFVFIFHTLCLFSPFYVYISPFCVYIFPMCSGFYLCGLIKWYFTFHKLIP